MMRGLPETSFSVMTAASRPAFTQGEMPESEKSAADGFTKRTLAVTVLTPCAFGSAQFVQPESSVDW